MWTQVGWLFLAVVVDLFSRKVVGWALQATLASVRVEEVPCRWRSVGGSPHRACCTIRIEGANMLDMTINLVTGS